MRRSRLGRAAAYRRGGLAEHDAGLRRPTDHAQVILGLASFLFQRDMDLLIIAPLSHMNSLIIQA